MLNSVGEKKRRNIGVAQGTGPLHLDELKFNANF